MQKKWYIEENNYKIDNDGDKYSCLIDKILYKRGIVEKEQRQKFLNPSLDDLYDPFLLKGMDQAVNRILKAVKNKEKIIIYGDYDVDGITATAILYRFFKNVFDLKVDYYLPDRIKEGYGLNKEAVTDIINKNYDLLITVDCGITAIEQVKLAQSENLDVIISDHHQPADQLPPALAVIDPHRKDSKYPFNKLSGAGLAFKLCQALEQKENIDEKQSFLEDLLDITTVGSVADIVPLKDENRIIVKKGLQLIKNSKTTGLAVLINKLGLEKDITAGHIGYIIAPPLNAAGRIEDAETGLKLLITESTEEAEVLADKLIKTNKKRQLKEQKTFEEALEMIKEIDLTKTRSIILASENWHPGVIGIVASRIVERYYRPVILIALNKGTGKASCRSIEGLNIYEALKKCSDYLVNFGGHSQAAGLTVLEDNIKKFKKEFNKVIDKILTDDDLIPTHSIDSILDLEMINRELYDYINKLEPFGVGNPAPVFLLNNVKVKKIYPVGKKKKHLKIKLDKGIDGIGFNMGSLADIINQEARVDITFKLSINEWQGRISIQIQLYDIKPRKNNGYYPVCFKYKDIIICDKRGCQDHSLYLKKINKSHKKIVVFENNKRKREKLLSNINNSYSEENIKKFKEKKQSILIYSGNKIPVIPEIDELIFMSLPFSLLQMVAIINSFKFSQFKFHFVFGKKEYQVNKKLIKKKLDLSSSEGYNGNNQITERFKKLSHLVFKKDLFEIMLILNNKLQEENKNAKRIYKEYS